MVGQVSGTLQSNPFLQAAWGGNDDPSELMPQRDGRVLEHQSGHQRYANGGAQCRSRHQADNRYHAAVEAIDADGSTACPVLGAVNGYSFTPLAAIEAARRVLAGEVRTGFPTPVDIFGSGFAESIADTRITPQGAQVAHAR